MPHRRDVAASQLGKKGRYRFGGDRDEMNSEKLVSRLVSWCQHYPIISVEDPAGEDDDEGMRAFTSAAQAASPSRRCDLPAEKPEAATLRDSRKSDVRMRANIHALPGHKLHWPHLIEEDERANHLALAMR